MSETNHTPGPYTAVPMPDRRSHMPDRPEQRYTTYYILAPRPFGEPSGITIAKVFNVDMDRDKGNALPSKANSDLLAAAPELFAALSALVDEVTREFPVSDLGLDLSAARAAISHAKGQDR